VLTEDPDAPRGDSVQVLISPDGWRTHPARQGRPDGVVPASEMLELTEAPRVDLDRRLHLRRSRRLDRLDDGTG